MTVASLWNPITDIGKSAANAVFGALWSEIGNAAQAVTSALWGAITSSTDISFTSVAWRGGSTQHLLAVVLQLSGAVMLLMVFLAVIRAVVRGDPGAAARAVLVDLPISCVAAVALVGITAAVVGASDQAADQIMSLAPSAALNSFAHNWPALITNLQFVGGLGGVIFILGAFMVWLELIVRAGLVYLMVATAPLVLAMRIFPGFAPAWKKFAETAVAVILSKVFVAIALVLGLSLTTGGVIPTGTAAGTGADIGQLIAGIAMMALAAFAPFVLLRFVPVVEGGPFGPGDLPHAGPGSPTGHAGLLLRPGTLAPGRFGRRASSGRRCCGRRRRRATRRRSSPRWGNRWAERRGTPGRPAWRGKRWRRGSGRSFGRTEPTFIGRRRDHRAVAGGGA